MLRSSLLTAAVFSQAEPLSKQASVDPTGKRRLSMNMFASALDKAEVPAAYQKLIAEGKAEQVASVIRPLGQVVGVIYEVNPMTGKLPDGSQKEGLVAIGDFEAVIYRTGEIFETSTAYFPKYFLEHAKATLDKTGVAALEFAIEILLVPTGKEIPVAYEVRNLRSRAAESPVNKLKAELAAKGILRLSPPVPVQLPAPTGELEQPVIEGTAREIERPAVEPETSAPPAEDPDAPELELEPDHEPITETPELETSQKRRQRA